MEKQAWIQHLKSLEKNAIIAATGRAAHLCAQLHSKIGGIPDLPPDFVWPYFENARGWESSTPHPLSFIAQILLEDLIPYDLDHLLPTSGILYFFFDLVEYEENEQWDRNVFYYDGDLTLLKPRPLPEELTGEERIPEFNMTYHTLIDHPGNQEYRQFYDVEKKYEEWDERYEEDAALAGYPPRSDYDDRVFKFLGYGDIIQNEVLSSAVFMHKSLSPDEEETQPQDWINLFQTGFLLSSDYEQYWLDAGSLYFYIRKQDLAQRNFHHVCAFHECG